ncbi:hypothetical protein LTR53_015030 [Teratosphaeriaceae sp. CCFEE 6253]|nr:hypothetical protein LTR53_015030 [Teratosphaeriaceae sp. CCFEE 6253]
MAHIKLANPRRALYSQVLLSNFMYSYLAKVQALHPQMQIPASQQQKAQQQQQQQQSKDQPAEYSQYQRWQEQQSRQEQDHSNGAAASGPKRSNGEGSSSSAGAAQHPHPHPHPHPRQQQPQRSSHDHAPYRSSFDAADDGGSSSSGHDPRSSEEYEGNTNFTPVGGAAQQYSREAAQARVNGIMGAPAGSGGGHAVSGGGGGGGGPGPGGYSVASTHDYLGYPKDQQPFGTGQQGLWDDDRASEELW